MCKRKDAVKDPLARLLFERYSIHLLNHPRSDVQVGDLYVLDGNTLLGSGSVVNAFDSGFELPPIALGERATRLEDTASDNVAAEVGLSLLDKLFAALKFDGTQIRAEYKSNNATAMRFRFEEPRRDSIDVLALTDRLYVATPKRHQLANDNERYFLATGVLRSTGISVTAVGEDSEGVEIGLKIAPEVNARTSLQLESKNETWLTYSGPEPLAFGVELIELTYDRKSKRVVRSAVDDVVRLRSPQFASEPRVEETEETDTVETGSVLEDLFIEVGHGVSDGELSSAGNKTSLRLSVTVSLDRHIGPQSPRVSAFLDLDRDDSADDREWLSLSKKDGELSWSGDFELNHSTIGSLPLVVKWMGTVGAKWNVEVKCDGKELARAKGTLSQEFDEKTLDIDPSKCGSG